MVVFEERGKPENREKNLSEQRRELTTNFYLLRSSPGHILGDLGTFLRFFVKEHLHMIWFFGGLCRCHIKFSSSVEVVNTSQTYEFGRCKENIIVFV